MSQLQQTNIQQQPQQQRPPVPLFSSSSNSISQPTNVAAMAGKARSVRPPAALKLTRFTDLHSNNSFDSGAGIYWAARAQSDASPWEAPISAFTAVNPSVSGSTRTVSPKDLFLDPLQSAPPSTTFTNITSPDAEPSPYLTDNFDTSPLFGQEEQPLYGKEDFAASNGFYTGPLFPEDEVTSFMSPTNFVAALATPSVAPELERTVSSNSAGKSSASSVSSPIVLDRSQRRKSSVNGSPVTNASITKPRRRKGPLPTIAVDPNDKVALKRARNTLAARDSRQRKFDHVNTLEKRNAELEAELEKWKSIAYAQGYTGS